MTLSLNTLAMLGGQTVLVIAAYAAFKGRTDAVLESNDNVMKALTNRFEKHEVEDDRRFTEMQERDDRRFADLQNRFLDLVGSVQRLIGQAEQRRQTRP